MTGGYTYSAVDSSLNLDLCIRGAFTASRLANYYPDRFLAFGFLAVGYYPPDIPQPYEEAIQTVCCTLFRSCLSVH